MSSITRQVTLLNFKLEKIIVLPLEGYDENLKKVKYLTHLVQCLALNLLMSISY